MLRRMDEELREFVRFRLALGKDDYETILSDCADYLGDDSADFSQVVIEEFESYLEEQRTWPDLLDSDRLLLAFGDLNTAGIVARTDFTCCLRCGTSEIDGEIPDGQERRGYVFAHHQDMEVAAEGHGCYLAFGVFSDAGDVVEIGEEVVAALRGHGLSPAWNGDPSKRIHVPLTWRRRRFGRLASWPGGPEPQDASPRPLEVFYRGHRGRRKDTPTPVSYVEARDVLLELDPHPGNFAGFIGRSGGRLQVTWTRDGTLSLESSDPARRRSRRRDVTMTEAERMIRILAEEDRVAVDEPGEPAIEHRS